ncbi:MAG TPA: CDP-diacylglycerol diphosphatase [Caulobacteraceae bacterium]|nr:CDP-diacylglycerol diphosphatase [Caulobacteraceae bacterium]
MNWRARARGALAAVFAFAALAAASPALADPEALWKIVHDICVAGKPYDPKLCLDVDAARGDTVIKDRDGATQLLLIPSTRATGIESAAVLAPDAPNYWWDAWKARSYLEKIAGQPVPRDDLALAVNSIDGRSQNQLHIHVDCIQPAVKTALEAAKSQIGRHWSPITLEGHPYRAMRLTEAELAHRNLFRLLADSDPEARANMGLETLVLAGAIFEGSEPGFILLSDRANPEAGDYASGEELEDHACKILQPAR